MEARDHPSHQVSALKRPATETAISSPIPRKKALKSSGANYNNSDCSLSDTSQGTSTSDSTHSQVDETFPQVIQHKKFNTKEVRQHFDFNDLYEVCDSADIYNGVLDRIDNVVQKALLHATPQDVCFVKLYDSASDKEVTERFLPSDSVDDLVFDMSEKFALMSYGVNSLIDAESKMELTVLIIESPSGGGGQHRKLGTLQKNEVINKKLRHLFVPPTTDNNLCFSISLAFLLNPSLSTSEAEKEGRELHKSVGKSENEKVSFVEIVKFEQEKNCKIVIFWKTMESPGYTHYSSKTEPSPERTYYLFFHEKHYYGIKNIKGFMGESYWCAFCHKGYSRQNGHKCQHTCNVCLDPKCQKKKTIKCPDCLRICRSDICFKQHKVPMKRKKGNYSWCDLTKYCPACNRQYTINQTNKTPHKCSSKKCTHCKQPLEKNHQCFIQPQEAKEPSENLIFYDFETTQENGSHQANYVCAMHFSGECWTSEGESCVAEFFKRYRENKYKGYTFIAHNARGFDSYLLIRHLVQNQIKPKLLVQGSKVMSFEDKDFSQKYIDSLNFLPMKLSSLPSAMGFDQEKKGHFPHFFNTTENQNYIGAYPEPHYYGVDSMMPKERADFFEWYNSVKNGEFDFRKEMAEYCKNDVAILRTACLRFREELFSAVEVDPFESITIAGMCMNIYQCRFLPEKTLAITYPNCYIQGQKAYSKISIEWLEYVSASEDIHIQHALNAGEKEIDGHFLDGYSESSGECVGFEFLGCYHHGCLTCKKADDRDKKRQKTYGEINNECSQKLEKLRGTLNFTLRYIWEHEWENKKKNDPKVKEFMSKYNPPERLNPREALYGGRTNALCLHYRTEEDEKIHYYDFTSLYPFINKTKVYPTGHPTIIFHNFKSVKEYFGLIRAKVYPPRGLFHPVLPYRAAGKLMFPLCRTCCETEYNEAACPHSNDERALTGVWTSIELVKAEEKGYTIARLFEVWHFEKTSDTLFSEYVNTFLKTKQEASGYPAWAVTDADKEKYIQDYEQHEKILLNQKNIKVNKAKRSLSKLALNSLWGKFAQRTNPSNSTLISDPEEFIEYIFSYKYDVTNVSFLNDDVALVQWKYRDDSSATAPTVNIFIGAFTTAYARLELYDVMDKLQQRVLYHDTDSVIFVCRPGDWMPETGDFLGQLTNELSDNDHIVEFVSGGPKLYGYRTFKNKTCMKVKGITLNYTNQQSVNLESLTGLVENYVMKNPSEIPTSTSQIARDKKGFHLKNKIVKKNFRVVYNKRVLGEKYNTLPYGY